MRITVKVGTSTLTHRTGNLNIRHVEELCKVISDLKNAGNEIILVSSGAIGMGVGKLALREKPRDMPTKQAAAAVGQCELMYTYDRLLSAYGHVVGQILVTGSDLKNAERYINFKNTLNRLLEMQALPIINENDTVATEEIEFGDNDTLSAVVARIVKADALVILTDIDGLHAENPKQNPDAPLIHVVEEVTEDTRRIAGGAGSSRGTGGMYTKIIAAGQATREGITTAIIDGSTPENLYRLLEGEEIGTVFPARGGC